MQGVPEQHTLHEVGRSLQQVEVTVVDTAWSLQHAVLAGMPHIEIRAHLDLTVLGVSGNRSYGDRVFDDIPETVKSIRVRRCLGSPGLLQQSSRSCAANGHQSCFVHALKT